MNKILIVSHGELANGLLDAARLIVGEIPKIAALGLMPGEDPESFRERLYAEIEAESESELGLEPKPGLAQEPELKPESGAELEPEPGSKQGVLVLVDILCGTPFNSMIGKLREPGIEMVIGVNLPMLLETIMHREDDLAVLADYAKQMGVQGILTKKNFMDGLKETEEQDEHTIYPD